MAGAPRKFLPIVVVPGLVSLFVLLLALTPVLEAMDKALFDLMLGMKQAPPPSKDLVLLDIDDDAIAQVGIYPWPRSILADGLVTLRELGLKQVVFDIEFIDSSPPGVNKHYLDNGLKRDFDQTFGDIESMVNDLFIAIKEKRIAIKDADSGVRDLLGITKSEREDLYSQSRQVAVNNDEYLGQALRYFGNAYITLNRQPPAKEMTAEHKDRLDLAAQRFARPFTGDEKRVPKYGDFFVPLKPLLLGAHGAGMTNVEIDKDGKRRRIRLFESVNGKWYGQLAFSPLFDYLGQPNVIISHDQVLIQGAKFRDGTTKDIAIPLDPQGNMLINWQKEGFAKSFRHVSFNGLVRIKEQEESIVDRLLELSQSEAWGAANSNTALDMSEAHDAWRKLRDAALASGSEEAVTKSVNGKAKWLADVAEFVNGPILTDLSEILHGYLKTAEGDNKAALEVVTSEFDANTSLLKTDWKSFQDRYADLQNGVRDGLAFVGWTGTGTTDLGANPFQQEYALVGTHPNVVNTILQGKFLTETPAWWSWVLAPLLAFGLVFLLRDMPPLTQNLAGIGIVAAFLLLGLLLFLFGGVFVSLTAPLLSMFLSFVAFSLVRFLGSEQEKAFITKAFSTYLSPDVIAEIVQDPSRMKLGGDQKWMTAIFTDVKGFSTISEKLSATELVHLLNEYLSGMSDIVLNEKGTIDKYEGDAIIAFFGAPLDLPDHAARACLAAIRMRQLEESLNPGFLERKMTPVPLMTRIGINTGEMVVGNMGTERKMNYTIMGNAVNLSARLEGVNKQYGTWILTTEFTAGEAGESFLFRRLDRVRVVGINTPVRLMNLLGLKKEQGEEGQRLVDGFHAALEVFEERKWAAAASAFEKLAEQFPEDGPAKLYAKRAKDFTAKAPAADWDGVFNLTEK